MIEWGITSSKEVIHINDADRETQFYCPDCGEPLIAKNRQFEGRIKLYHFAHENGKACGSGEGDIHLNTKCTIYNILKECLESNSPYPAYLITKETLKDYRLNVLDNVNRIELEKATLGRLRPDISLMHNDKLIRSIEIVHTHEDRAEKNVAYIENDIQVCKVYIDEKKYETMKCTGVLPRIRVFDEQDRALCKQGEKPYQMIYRYYRDGNLGIKEPKNEPINIKRDIKDAQRLDRLLQMQNSKPRSFII